MLIITHVVASNLIIFVCTNTADDKILLVCKQIEHVSFYLKIV